MRHQERWRPTKFVFDGQRIIANRDTGEVSISSRHFANLLAAALSDVVPRALSGRLLDLGCGQVPLYGFYRAHVTTITCADWPSSRHPIQHVDLTCDVSRGLPFADGSFDSVLLTDVLEHVPTPAALLREIFRVLSPGGRLVLSVPFLYWLHEEPHDYFRYTEHALIRLGTEAGFAIERVRAFGSGLDVVADAFAKTIVPLHWRVGPLVAEISRRTVVWVGSTRVGSRLAASSASLPLGYVAEFKRYEYPPR